MASLKFSVVLLAFSFIATGQSTIRQFTTTWLWNWEELLKICKKTYCGSIIIIVVQNAKFGAKSLQFGLEKLEDKIEILGILSEICSVCR